ncbi:hypothetical protein F2P45_31440 [Massilia sp. CCM 8733]|uniref:Uncharacterized protein n=1 Tax=Massilia mucilaginosa TaxID=2609282 RepID=A0ABX0P2F1_9BURK|nr:hypothetical protein [Massilia mucilaginosa]NHZ93483.1 hypothetical protein [Massilia mucilaginosa]
MKKIGRDALVIDTSQWLPSYGATTVNLVSDGGKLSVIIEFDGEERLERKKLVFGSVCSFTESSFPGVTLDPFEYDQLRTVHLEALVAYPDSEAAKEWTEHFACSRIVRHYAICFLSANTHLTVFASNVVLMDME